ncbi:MAG: hypothetical protein NC489_35740 [Ruminococcus flavefaciens]|nr:hypothetical protein [Ruminococcus flavefaciens]
MEKEITYDGFEYYGPGCCPLCSGPLFVADSEVTLMELNQDGQPISEETAVRCRGKCSRCGHEVPMMRWQGNYVPYSKPSFLLKKWELMAKIKERNEALPKNENPLAL